MGRRTAEIIKLERKGEGENKKGMRAIKTWGGGKFFIEFLLEELVRIHLIIRSEIEHSFRENK